MIERKEAIPPFEPDVRLALPPQLSDLNYQLIILSVQQSKKANFDATHELEELLLEDNPLKARKRNPNLDVSQLSSDYRAMEQHFLPYDYLRQPRKSWFVLDDQGTAASAGVNGGGGGGGGLDPNSSSQSQRRPVTPIKDGSTPIGVRDGAVRIDQQPLADLTSRSASVSVNTASRSRAGSEVDQLGMSRSGSRLSQNRRSREIVEMGQIAGGQGKSLPQTPMATPRIESNEGSQAGIAR